MTNAPLLDMHSRVIDPINRTSKSSFISKNKKETKKSLTRRCQIKGMCFPLVVIPPNASFSGFNSNRRQREKPAYIDALKGNLTRYATLKCEF